MKPAPEDAPGQAPREEHLEVVVAALALARAAFRAFLSADLTLPQALVLWWLTRFPGCTAGQLAEDLGVEPSQISLVVQRLGRSGLIARVPDPRDRRRALLRITARGREAFRAARATIDRRLDQPLSSLSDEELVTVRGVLQGFALALGGGARETARARWRTPPGGGT
jgi:DNA-binding MarR family transcriptional regulator